MPFSVIQDTPLTVCFTNSGQDTELSTIDGKRKYLTLEEQERFLVATSQLDVSVR